MTMANFKSPVSPHLILPAAHGGIFLHAILTASADTEALPSKDKVSNVRPDEDANDKVSVVVHGQQHDKVRHGKGTRV